MAVTVAIVGATGETGSSIVKGLLQSRGFEITALVRPASLQKPKVRALADQGVKVVPVDLGGPEAEIRNALKGIDVVISAIFAGELLAQIPVIDASKAVGVKRFIPCFFATVAPPKGVLRLREVKEDVLNHVKKVYLPYTVIDVGWWYQITLPSLPSGRIDYATEMSVKDIAGDGSVPTALTDLRDIGKYVARIIVDPRTLNRMVFAYNEVHTFNDVYKMLEDVSGEKLKRNYVSAETIKANLAEAEKKSMNFLDPDFLKVAHFQYLLSWGIRGDNTPEYAAYLGYLNAKDLYPDVQYTTLETFAKELIEGKGQPVYEEMRALRAARASQEKQQ
ncbi:hypothetical protein VTK73DRAFT_3712 [Phialemonium thermophilum]|uniref:Semialdehyde dehydrogenase NAD-binding domain-containing protein n=1 Tax=Phialemonium thermophilum TaxID=223376 RepID=A0ABR3WXS7_9PEZI